ncbi:hypothetical protein F4821DRAFT_239324 [Hypoxylon rubiginosum]|uniref:Uncharacterized protein n=1 Tax=Hypoxylon rubiginosum TaxID=110542 RepID=A0ACC0D0A4_9PEZI|nr:hypothetical protein F4821DRAFT_239324 [Hypoxylon rubiginosum]
MASLGRYNYISYVFVSPLSSFSKPILTHAPINNMKAKTLFRRLILLMAHTSAWAMSITQMPRAEPTSTQTPDPWQCVTENITQYFNVPTPTGALLDALLSYGDELIEPCLSTATGLDALSCSVSETSAWCGFTTAAPSPVLTDYSSYGSAAASFWRAKSETISIIASECPVGWSKPGFSEHSWLNQTIAHAECYIAAHPVNTTTSSSPTTSSSTAISGSTETSPTSTPNGIAARTRGAEAFIFASTSVAAAVNAMW